MLLKPGGRQFAALPNTSLLESGLSAGVALPYSCANGSCGDCRAKILSGETKKIHFHDYALTEAEKLAGVCLLCANSATSNLTIEVSQASSAEDIPLQTLPAKVCHIEPLSRLSIVRFKLTRGKAFRFLPGQYATITLKNNNSIHLPIANCPCESNFIEFHSPDTLTGHANDLAQLSTLAPRDRVTLSGPHGTFTPNLQQQVTTDARRQSVFIAVGAGFAAIKPLIEQLMQLDQEPPCTLIWIATEDVTHYRHNLCRSWADAFDNIDYASLNSITDFTIDKIKKLQLTLANSDIYISGEQHCCKTVNQVLCSAGMPPDAITIDKTNHSR